MIDENFFKKGIAEIIEEKSLRRKLESGKKLRIKMGFDPTKPDLHIGHTVGLKKLKQLQDAGHTIIFLIGDYTAKIGDPSGKNTTRPVLTDAEIKENAKTYFDQVGLILDPKKAEIRYNSEWLKKLDFSGILQLLGKFTVAQIIERDDFQKRLIAHNDIGMHELLYPMMQAYDSVMLNADVEMGGSDQKFNLLAGRDLQRKMGQVPQDLIMVDLLVGLDGKQKMGKSLNNYIGITEDANTMFGKVMSLPDHLILSYFELATDLSQKEVEAIKFQLEAGENPRDIKMKLGFEITKAYHGTEAANAAKEEFINVFSKKELPAEIPEVKIDQGNYEISLLLMNLQAVASISEARRLIEQGGVRIEDAKITDPKSTIAIYSGMIVQVGKKRFYKIK